MSFGHIWNEETGAHLGSVKEGKIVDPKGRDVGRLREDGLIIMNDGTEVGYLVPIGSTMPGRLGNALRDGNKTLSDYDPFADDRK